MIMLFLASLAAQPATACSEEPTAQALICRAIDASNAGDHAGAAKAFEAIAEAATADVERAKALAAAGNLWIAANEPGKAALALDKALAGTSLQAEQRGEALLDRARAAEAQNDLDGARARLDQATSIIGNEPFLWYFSAALAIREGNQALAQTAIARALSLAPADPAVQFEAGHVAQVAGDTETARRHWSEAQRLDSGGPVGKAAAEALALLSAPPTSAAPAKDR
jgi:tetratricopeptide (TPR) repeat protein